MITVENEQKQVDKTLLDKKVRTVSTQASNSDSLNSDNAPFTPLSALHNPVGELGCILLASDLENIFYECFFNDFNTSLKGGYDEPLYKPCGDIAWRRDIAWRDKPHQDEPEHENLICYRYDYFASALHEVAHWCIAGEKRRKLLDYGYWYSPDGRTSEQQALFEDVEVKPQALEWAFSLAANAPFRVSIDNLHNAEQLDLKRTEQAFTEKVKNQLKHYIKHGFPQRAEQFISALQLHYKTHSLTHSLSEQLK